MKEEDIRKREVFNQYLELVKKDAKKMLESSSGFIKIPCPACQGKKYHNEFQKGGFNYVLCENCGTLFVNPRPSLETLKEFYETAPSSKFWVESFFKPVAEARREKIFKPRAEFIKDRFPDLSKGVIGDIGAGFGIFLEELKKLWPESKTVAIEPSPEMVKICQNKGLDVLPYPLEAVKDWDGKFDLLCSFELFEHLFNPKEFLTKIRDLLKSGGYIMLTTLNGEGFDTQILWEKSKSIFPPHHINFLNPNAIKTLLESTGFNVKELTTPGKLDWDIVEGMYKEEKTDIDRFWKLVSQKATPEAKSQLQEWISKNGFSSHMRIIAQKV